MVSGQVTSVVVLDNAMTTLDHPIQLQADSCSSSPDYDKSQVVDVAKSTSSIPLGPKRKVGRKLVSICA